MPIDGLLRVMIEITNIKEQPRRSSPVPLIALAIVALLLVARTVNADH